MITWEQYEALMDELRSLLRDAHRWRWLREQKGWPDSEAAMLGATPEDFDKLADEGIKNDN